MSEPTEHSEGIPDDWRCDACGWKGRPIMRIFGLPIPEDYALAETGQVVFMGCMADQWPPESHQCGGCGHGVDFPEEWDEEEDEDEEDEEDDEE